MLKVSADDIANLSDGLEKSVRSFLEQIRGERTDDAVENSSDENHTEDDQSIAAE